MIEAKSHYYEVVIFTYDYKNSGTLIPSASQVLEFLLIDNDVRWNKDLYGEYFSTIFGPFEVSSLKPEHFAIRKYHEIEHSLFRFIKVNFLAELEEIEREFLSSFRNALDQEERSQSVFFELGIDFTNSPEDDECLDKNKIEFAEPSPFSFFKGVISVNLHKNQVHIIQLTDS